MASTLTPAQIRALRIQNPKARARDFAAVQGITEAELVAAYVGFHAEPTIEGTSVATTRAVVNASLLVLMFNFILSALLFL